MDTACPDQTEPALGPASPTADAPRVAHRPLGLSEVSIDGGLLGNWQQVNRRASIPLGMRQLESAGNLHNLRLAAGKDDGEFTGPRFADSDVYKQLEAIAWEHGREPSPELAEFIEQTAALLAEAQGDDGYLNSYYQVAKPERRYAELEWSHELYCAGHLIQAAVAGGRVGALPELLTVARRFADHLVAEFLRGGRAGNDGHPEIETALVELYRLTGERDYLELAVHLVDQRGRGLISGTGRRSRYTQDHLPVREADTPIGHAVRQLYLDAGVVDVAIETGDTDLLACSVRRWEDMVRSKTYLTGALGSRHAREAFGDRYELPPDRAYAETCAAIASIHWSWRLLLATGNGRYADLIERTLYNGFAASTSADGERFFYVNPLQRRADHHEDDEPARRRGWFSCACCPPNIMRLVASFGHYLATTAGNVLFVHQYAPGTIAADLPSGRFELSAQTDYPWSGGVEYIVTAAPAAGAGLALRIPPWSRTGATALTVAGEPITGHALEPDEDGYVQIERVWASGDTIRLELDLAPRLTYPDRRIDAVRGCVAVERGPLVYCFEQVDQQPGADLEDLVLVPDVPLRAVEAADLSGIGRTVVIEVDALVDDNPSPDGLPYGDRRPSSDGRSTEPVTATAIPYFQWDNRDDGPMRVWLPYDA